MISLFKYSLWNFDASEGWEEAEDDYEEIEDEEKTSDDYNTFLRITKFEHVVVMPNAFYIPFMNGYSVLPIQDLGKVVNTNALLYHQGKHIELLDRYDDVYLPFEDFRWATKIFAEALTKGGYPLQAERLELNTKEHVRQTGYELSRKEINFLKKYDTKIDPRASAEIEF